MRFLGWAGVENPWVVEEDGSSSACEDESERSGSEFEDSLSADLQARYMAGDPQTRREANAEKDGGTKELRNIDGFKVMIRTAKDGTTKTILSALPHTKLENGVEIVTKTCVRGDNVTTVTTTTLIPLAGTISKKASGD